MRFIHSAGATLVFKAIAMIAGLAASIIIARVLGTEGRGVYALVMSIIVMAASFGVFGLTASNTYYVAGQSKRVRAIGLHSLLAGILGTLLTILIVLGVRYAYPSILQGLNDYLLWLTLAIVPLFLWGNLFSFAYLGRGKIFAFNAFETTQRVIFFALSVLMLWVMSTTFELYFAVVLATVAVLVFSYMAAYFVKAPEGPLFSSELLQPSFAYGIRAYVATLLTLAVMRSAVFFVNYIGGNREAGLFAVAQQASELLIIVPSAVGTILFGRISGGDSDNLTPKVVRTIAFVFLPVSIGLFFASDVLVVSIFGAEFLPAAGALRWLIPGSYLLGLEVLLANDIAGRGYPWTAVLFWVPALILNFTAYYFLIPSMGINGASISLSLSFTLMFVLISVYYMRTRNVSFSELFVIKSEDIRTLLQLLKASPKVGVETSDKETYDAAATAHNKDKAETQSVSG